MHSKQDLTYHQFTNLFFSRPPILGSVLIISERGCSEKANEAFFDNPEVRLQERSYVVQIKRDLTLLEGGRLFDEFSWS